MAAVGNNVTKIHNFINDASDWSLFCSSAEPLTFNNWFSNFLHFKSARKEHKILTSTKGAPRYCCKCKHLKHHNYHYKNTLPRKRNLSKTYHLLGEKFGTFSRQQKRLFSLFFIGIVTPAFKKYSVLILSRNYTTIFASNHKPVGGGV